jgi:hypothetical protein
MMKKEMDWIFDIPIRRCEQPPDEAKKWRNFREAAKPGPSDSRDLKLSFFD